MSRSLWRWGPALLWTALLFFASSQQTLPVDLRGGSDKLAHLGAYTVLGLFLARGQSLSEISVFWPLALGTLIGGLDELYQGTVPGRSPDVGDWIADSAGILAGVALYHIFHPGRRRSSRARSIDPISHER